MVIEEKLTKHNINELPLYSYTGIITFVDTDEVAKKALHEISFQPVIGFDTETKPTFRKGVIHNPSILQVAVPNHVFIFSLRHLGLSETLRCFLENPHIIKTGVAIHDDFKGLARIAPFFPQGTLDLAHIATQHGISNPGLRGLTAYFLGKRISKSEQCSNWARKELTDKQRLYAATDAWVSLKIYLRMSEMGLL